MFYTYAYCQLPILCSSRNVVTQQIARTQQQQKRIAKRTGIQSPNERDVVLDRFPTQTSHPGTLTADRTVFHLEHRTAVMARHLTLATVGIADRRLLPRFEAFVALSQLFFGHHQFFSYSIHHRDIKLAWLLYINGFRKNECHERHQVHAIIYEHKITNYFSHPKTPTKISHPSPAFIKSTIMKRIDFANCW